MGPVIEPDIFDLGRVHLQHPDVPRKQNLMTSSFFLQSIFQDNIFESCHGKHSEWWELSHALNLMILSKKIVLGQGTASKPSMGLWLYT